MQQTALLLLSAVFSGLLFFGGDIPAFVLDQSVPFNIPSTLLEEGAQDARPAVYKGYGFSMSIEARTAENITVVISNENDESDLYVHPGYTCYVIEQLTDNIWVPCPMVESMTADLAMAYWVNPGETTFTFTYSDRYGELPPGHYRILTKIEVLGEEAEHSLSTLCWLGCEFEVE